MNLHMQAFQTLTITPLVNTNILNIGEIGKMGNNLWEIIDRVSVE